MAKQLNEYNSTLEKHAGKNKAKLITIFPVGNISNIFRTWPGESGS